VDENKFYLKKIRIKNFRNFEDIEVNTTRKNIVIGMNDVGKTNLLYALKMVFDYRVRNIDLLESDFHKKRKDIPFEIIISINIGKNDSFYSDLILSEIKNLRKSQLGNEDILNIKLIGDFFKGISMFWNVSIDCDNIEGNSWEEIPAININKNKIDFIFKVFDIPPYNEIKQKFREFKRNILQSRKEEEKEDIIPILEEQSVIRDKINELDTVKKIQNEITNTLKKFNVSYGVKVLSTLGLKNIYDDLEIFNIQNQDDEIYPTSGDGRRKTILYALFLYEILQEVERIPIVLLEEPENHLFINSQISLSKTILEGNEFSNIFLSTHSPELLYCLTKETNIIRIVREDNKTVSRSSIFNLPREFDKLKNVVQKDLVRALFCKEVLLVEGYSEKILFDYILDEKVRNIEDRTNKFILNIIGVNFEPYYNFLKDLGIKILLKTDNDLKRKASNKIELYGINRVCKLLNLSNEADLDEVIVARDKEKEEDREKRFELMKKVYLDKKELIKRFEEFNCYLSEVDFENDLAVVLEKDKSFVKKLQESKWYNLYEGNFFEEIFNDTNIEKILASEHFKCIKELING
jgi:putative ATP-dependent endonuclease of OLD family